MTTIVQRGIIGLSVAVILVLILNMLANRPAQHLAHHRGPVKIAEKSQFLRPYEPESDRRGGPKEVAVDPKLEAKLWGKPEPSLEACWSTGLKQQREKAARPRGFVVVTCANGAHNHRAQIAEAVVIATQLGATLVLPHVKEAQKEPHSGFDDLYNVRNFITSLDGIVRVVGKLPAEVASSPQTIVRIPLRVSREYIEEHVRPVFEANNNLVHVGNFQPLLKDEKEDPEFTALRCLVMHKALDFVILVQKLGNRLLNRMREAAPKSASNRFVAIDLQVDLLRHRTCNATIAKKKRCLEPSEVGTFLKALGYPSETSIYLTQSRWHSSLDSLQNMYPNIHTKEYSMPFNEENQYLFSGKTQFEQAVDYYVCSRADVFIPTVPGMFYGYVSGERIIQGLNHILVPSFKDNSLEISGIISPYVEKTTHPVYSCFCGSSRRNIVERTTESVLKARKGRRRTNQDEFIL